MRIKMRFMRWRRLRIWLVDWNVPIWWAVHSGMCSNMCVCVCESVQTLSHALHLRIYVMQYNANWKLLITVCWHCCCCRCFREFSIRDYLNTPITVFYRRYYRLLITLFSSYHHLQQRPDMMSSDNGWKEERHTERKKCAKNIKYHLLILWSIFLLFDIHYRCHADWYFIEDSQIDF